MYLSKLVQRHILQDLKYASKWNMCRLWCACGQSISQVQTQRHFSKSVASEKKWHFRTKPFGKLIVNTADTCDVDIKVINPQKYPLQNQIFVELSEENNAIVCEQKGEELHISAADQLQNKTQNLNCDVQIPIKYDLEINVTGSSNVSVQNFENDNILVKAEAGTCSFRNIQTGDMEVLSSGGNVLFHKLLQGNPTIKTLGAGNITGDKIQGLSFTAESESGNIDMKAVYSDLTNIKTKTGDVHLKSCHRTASIDITEKGNLTIGGLDGNMTANVATGDIEVFAIKPEKLNLTSQKGNVMVKMMESTDARVELSGKDIVIHEDLVIDKEETQFSENKTLTITGHVHHVDNILSQERDPLDLSPPRVVNVSAPDGTVSLQCQDWLASLKLQAKLDD